MPGRRLWWLGLCLWLSGAGSGTAEPCRGLPCAGGETPAPPCRGLLCGGRAGRPARSSLHTASPVRPPQGKAPPAAPHAAPPPPRSPAGGAPYPGSAPYPGARRGLPACSGGDCAVNGTRRDCQGLECRLPARLRPRPRGSGCVAPADGCPEPALLRAAERAAHFAGDDFAYAASELGGSALGLQLTCDVKPGAGRPEGAGRERALPRVGRSSPRAEGSRLPGLVVSGWTSLSRGA